MKAEKHRPAGRDSLHGGVEDVSGAERCPRG